MLNIKRDIKKRKEPDGVQNMYNRNRRMPTRTQAEAANKYHLKIQEEDILVILVGPDPKLQKKKT